MQTSTASILCFSKNKHKLSQPLLQPCTSRHERKRGSAVTAAGKASEQHALLHGCSQASSSASKLILCQRKLPKHASSCLSMHKTVKVCEKLSSTKVSSRKHATRLLLESLRAKQKESYFSGVSLVEERWKRCRWYKGSIGFGTHLLLG